MDGWMDGGTHAGKTIFGCAFRKRFTIRMLVCLAIIGMAHCMQHRKHTFDLVVHKHGQWQCVRLYELHKSRTLLSSSMVNYIHWPLSFLSPPLSHKHCISFPVKIAQNAIASTLHSNRQSFVTCFLIWFAQTHAFICSIVLENSSSRSGIINCSHP